MVWYILFVLISLSFIVNEKDRWFSLSIPLLFLLELLLWQVYPATTDFGFFYSRAVFDCVFILLCYVFKDASIWKRNIVASCAGISLCINVYLCLDQTNNFIYRYWEYINLVLCEIIIITLYLESLKMFNTFKVKLYAFFAFIGIALFGWIKILQTNNEKLKKKVDVQKQLKEVAERNTFVVEKKHKDSVELNKALSDVKTDSDKIEAENNENRIKKVRPNRGDVFGDSRLK